MTRILAPDLYRQPYSALSLAGRSKMRNSLVPNECEVSAECAVQALARHRRYSRSAIGPEALDARQECPRRTIAGSKGPAPPAVPSSAPRKERVSAERGPSTREGRDLDHSGRHEMSARERQPWRKVTPWPTPADAGLQEGCPPLERGLHSPSRGGRPGRVVRDQGPSRTRDRISLWPPREGTGRTF